MVEGENMRLLVVEDNASLLESIVQILHEFEVDTALNGEEGLFLALQNIYDAILLDVMMPEMDGFEVIQKYVMKRLKHQSYF